MTTSTSEYETALHANEKAFALLQPVHVLKDTDNDGVEHLLAVAVEALKKD